MSRWTRLKRVIKWACPPEVGMAQSFEHPHPRNPGYAPVSLLHFVVLLQPFYHDNNNNFYFVTYYA